MKIFKTISCLMNGGHQWTKSVTIRYGKFIIAKEYRCSHCGKLKFVTDNQNL